MSIIKNKNKNNKLNNKIKKNKMNNYQHKYKLITFIILIILLFILLYIINSRKEPFTDKNMSDIHSKVKTYHVVSGFYIINKDRLESYKENFKYILSVIVNYKKITQFTIYTDIDEIIEYVKQFKKVNVLKNIIINIKKLKFEELPLYKLSRYIKKDMQRRTDLFKKRPDNLLKDLNAIWLSKIPLMNNAIEEYNKNENVVVWIDLNVIVLKELIFILNNEHKLKIDGIGVRPYMNTDPSKLWSKKCGLIHHYFLASIMFISVSNIKKKTKLFIKHIYDYSKTCNEFTEETILSKYKTSLNMYPIQFPKGFDKNKNIQNIKYIDFENLSEKKLKNYISSNTPIIFTNVIKNNINFNSFCSKLSNKKLKTFTMDRKSRNYIYKPLKEYCYDINNNKKYYGGNNKITLEEIQKLGIKPNNNLFNNFRSGKLWIGPKNSRTSLHKDKPENLALQIYGEKQWTIFNNNDNKNLCYSDNNKKLEWSAYELNNYNTCKSAKKAKPIVLVLKQGEMLYLPKQWSHDVKNVSNSIMINFWYDNSDIFPFK